MADDITLTVRVRDMTRGDFNQIRQRMRGMEGDIRRVGQTTQGAANQADRMGREIQRLDNRMGHLHRTGRMAGEEMTHMRRTMSLLGRDLRQAARDGNLTEDQFSSLSRQLERTRLDFDYLARDIERHSTRANRAAREERRRQTEAHRMGQLQARAQREDAQRTQRMGRIQARAMREESQRVQRMGQLQAQALRANAQRDAARQRRLQQMGQLQARALREESQRIHRLGQMQARAIREDEVRTQRAGQLHARALREDEERAQRMGRIHAQAIRMDEARTASIRRQADARARAAAQAQRQSVGRLAGLGGPDRDLTLRFRALGEDDVRRMSRGFDELQRTVGALSGSTARARRNVSTLNGDLRVMARALQDADDAGSLSRREFNALSNGLRMAVRDMRMLRGSTDMSRSTLRGMRREVAGLRAQLTLLGNEGTRVRRLDASLLLLQRRMRDNRHGAGLLRRSMSRVGEGMVGGLRGGMLGTAALIGLMGKLGDKIKLNKRWTMILVAALLLIGPIAQALGGLLVAALGGAFIALGALALKNSDVVKGAFREMKEVVASTAREAAKPMEGDLVRGIRSVGEAVDDMFPALRAAFTATGPLIEDFFGAFTDFAGFSLDGIVTSLEQMGPAMEGFRSAMAMVGKGFGDMFAAMTANGGAEALRDVWLTLGRELANLLVGIGEFINMATQSGTATMLLVGVFRSLSGVLNIVETGLAVVDTMFGSLFQHINQNVLGFADLTGGIEGMSTSFVDSGQSAGELKKQLADVNKEIAEMKKVRDVADELGPSGGEFHREKFNATDQDLAAAQTKRRNLLAAISEAESGAAANTREHAAAVKSLTQSMQELNNEMLGKLDARAQMEASIDDAIKKAEDFTGKVRIQNGEFDLNHKKSRDVYTSLSRIAKETASAAAEAEKAHAPLSEINAVWARGREQLLALAPAYGIPRGEMEAFIDTVLQTPESVRTKLELDKEQADAAVAETQRKLREVDGTKAEAQATVDHFRAMERASQVTSQLNAIDGRTATATLVINQFKTTTIKTIQQYQKEFLTGRSQHDITGATGGKFTGRAFKRGYANGGRVHGPGTGTSDDVFAPWLSNGEFVIRADSVRKYGERFLNMINDGSFAKIGFAKGGSVRGEARQAIKPIKEATSGATEKNLLRLMSQIIKGSIKMATALKSVTSALDKAKNKLSSIKSEAKSLSESVKSRTMTGITEGVDSDKAVTMSALMTRMTQGRDKATAFASALKRLRKRGLAKGLLRQIAEAGVDGGGLETAGALLRGSGSELKSINSLYGQMSKAGSSAGKTTADALFGAQIKSQEKLVKALTELSNQLKKATAKSKKKATGGIIGAASGGLRGGLVEVGEQGPELVRLPFGSSVYSNPDSRRIAGQSGGSSGQPMVLQVFIGEKKVDEIVLDSNRRTVRTRGGNVQAIFSQR